MIRTARPSDVPDLLRLVRDLAAYEREPDAALATEGDLRAALFPPTGAPAAGAHVAETNGALVGMAIWFTTFSTWTGKAGMWLEDLYVEPEHRHAGHGSALLAELAAECLRRGYRRLEWAVLDWNTPAIEVYRALGARPLTEWTTQRLDGADLSALASRADQRV